MRTKDEIVGYVFQTFEDVIGKKLARRYREERLTRGIKTREIISDDDEYLTSAILKLTKTTPYLQNSKWRYLPSKKIKIDHTFVIYNDIVSIYNWYKGEIFGVEIYNETVATLQKQIFEILWGLAEKPEITLKKKLGKK